MTSTVETAGVDTAVLLKRIETLERENKALNALASAPPALPKSAVETSKTVLESAAPVASEGEPAAHSSIVSMSSSISSTASSLSLSALPTSEWGQLSPHPQERMMKENVMLDVTDGCSCSFAGSQFYSGRLIVTDLLLSFVTQQPTPYPSQHFIVDLALIEYVKVEKKPKLEEGSAKLGEFPVSFACKDGRNLVFRLRQQAEQKALLQVADSLVSTSCVPVFCYATPIHSTTPDPTRSTGGEYDIVPARLS